MCVRSRTTRRRGRQQPLVCSGCRSDGICWPCRGTSSRVSRIQSGSGWGAVTWPGFLEVGRRQEVTAKSQASGVESSPCGIRTSTERSRLARCGSPSESGAAFSFRGWRPASWAASSTTWATSLCLRLWSPAHGQTAVWSQKRSKTWPHKGHCETRARNGMRRRICRASFSFVRTFHQRPG